MRTSGRLALTALLALSLIVPVRAAVDFDGTGDYVSLPTDAVTGIDSTVRTVSAWVTVDANGSAHNIYTTGTALSAGNFRDSLQAHTSGPGFVFRWSYGFSTTAGVWATPTQLTVGTLYHIAVVYDRTDTTTDPDMYVNGSLVAESETTAPSGTTQTGQDCARAGASVAAGNAFNGKAAEIGHWDVALTAGEIAALANRVPPNRIRSANLKVYLPLYSTTNYVDNLAAANIGTVTGNPTNATHPPIAPAWGFLDGWLGAFATAAADPGSPRFY